MKTDSALVFFNTSLVKLKYVLLAFFTFLIYFSTFSHNFLPDDWYLLGVYQKFDLFREFIIAYFGGYFSLPVIINGFYRPINSLFYHFGYYFFGLNPTGYKVIVFIFFILCTYLVFKLCNEFFNDEYISFLASVIYISRSVHDLTLLAPSGIVNVCSDFFMLASLYCYLNFKNTGRGLFFILSLMVYFGAFFSKEGSVILFLLILLLELFYFNKEGYNLSSIFKRMFPFFIIFLLYLIRIFIFRVTMINAGPYQMSFSSSVILHNFLFYMNALFNNQVEIFLFVIFLIFCMFLKIDTQEFIRKNSLFAGIIFIGIGPYLFLTTHLETYYCGFSAVGFSGIFAYFLLSKISANLWRTIALTTFVVFFILSGFFAFQLYQDIKNPTNAFTFQEQKINNVINYLKQTNMSYDNSTIVFVHSDMTLFSALGYGSAVKLHFPGVREVYFDAVSKPVFTNDIRVIYVNYDDRYQNISLLKE